MFCFYTFNTEQKQYQKSVDLSPEKFVNVS